MDLQRTTRFVGGDLKRGRCLLEWEPVGHHSICPHTAGGDELDCNLEVVPGRLGLDELEAHAVANWLQTYGAIDALELASGPYEQWARLQLLDPASPPNVEGREVAAMLNEKERCYFWFWQPDADEDFEPRTTCPFCNEALVRYDDGIFPQLLCEQDSVVLVGR